jgi:hypothetical protein
MWDLGVMRTLNDMEERRLRERNTAFLERQEKTREKEREPKHRKDRSMRIKWPANGRQLWLDHES